MARPARWGWWVGAVAGLAAGAALAVGLLWRPAREVPALAAAPVALVPGVYYLGGLDPSVAYAVETPEGLVLVDSGLAADAKGLREQLGALGLDWETVRAVLLTHVHGDHCGGADALRRLTGARVYAGKADAAVLRAGAPRDAFFSIFDMTGHETHPTTVDVELVGGEELTFGDVRFRAIAAPGHTPGSVCYLVERGPRRIFFSGDVISNLVGGFDPHTGGRNPLGTYAAYLAPRYRGDASAYLATLRALRALPAPDLLLPGHPHSDPAPQSPRMTRARWDEMLDRGVREMETLVARYEREGTGFLDGIPRQILPGLYYLGDHAGRAVYGLVAASRLVLVNAPGGSGLADFVESRLRQLGVEPSRPAEVLLTSCNASELGGLGALVERFRARVVAPDWGVEAVTKLCPEGTEVVAATDYAGKAGFPMRAVPLRGPGAAQSAYLLPWAGKTVLFSGTIPVAFEHQAAKQLFLDLIRSRTETLDFLLSVERLDGSNPDVWLPAVPANGQNAVLDAGMWRDVVAKNYGAGSLVLRGFEMGMPWRRLSPTQPPAPFRIPGPRPR